MLDPNQFENAFRQFSAALPENVQKLQADFEKNFRAAFEVTLRKMNLITREEFDVQVALLQRMQARIETLEARLTELENRHPALEVTTSFTPDNPTQPTTYS